ncbi:MAG: DUF2142 domain-containing protein [Pseudomonas sp.]
MRNLILRNRVDIALALVVTVCVLIGVILTLKQPISIEFEMAVTTSTSGQIFYDPQGEFSEAHSVHLDLKPDGNFHTYVVSIPAMDGGRIRIDPGNAPGQVKVRKIVLHSARSRITYAKDGLARIQLLNHLMPNGRGDVLLLTSTGNDPSFSFLLPVRKWSIGPEITWVIAVLAAGFIIFRNGALIFTASRRGIGSYLRHIRGKPAYSSKKLIDSIHPARVKKPLRFGVLVGYSLLNRRSGGFSQRILWWLFLAASVLMAAAAYALIVPSASVSLDLQGKGTYQIFYDSGAGFNEAESRRFNLHDNGKRAIYLDGLPVSISSLRIDPEQIDSELSICLPSRRADVFVPFIPSIEGEGYIKSGHQVIRVNESSPYCTTWTIQPGANDPQIHIGFAPQLSSMSLAKNIGSAALLLFIAGFGMLALVFYGLPAEVKDRFRDQSQILSAALDKHLLVIFLVLGFVLGGGYAVVTPPGSVPDELAHAGKIARISVGDWLGNDQPGPFPPAAEWYGPFVDYLHNPRTFSVEEVREVASSTLRCEETNFDNPDAAASAAPVQYFPSTLVYLASCTQSATFGTFLYGSRLLNLAIYLVLVGLGIHYAGFGRWALFSVSLLPMSLYLGASISYDSALLAGTFCLFGIVSGVYSGRLSCKKALLPILLVSLFLAFQKPQSGWVFVLPVIVLLRCREQGYSVVRWSLLTILVPLILHMSWIALSVSISPDRPDVLAVNGFGSLISNPGRSIQVFYDTYTSAVGISLAKGVVGVFGWLDVYMSTWGYVASLTAIVFSCAITGVGRQLSLNASIFVLISAVGAFLVTNVPFYTLWTEPSSLVIQGLQGRYFITMVALIMMVVPPYSPTVAALFLRCGCIALLVGSSVSAYLAICLRYFN